MSDENSIKRKLVIVGDTCGKTCLLIRFKEDYFWTGYVGTVFENSQKEIEIDESQTVELDLWDTAGPFDYDRLRPLSYPNADVVLICCDVNSKITLSNVEFRWFPEIRNHLPDVPIILVASKTDLYGCGEVTEEDVINVKKKNGAVGHMMVSAKTGENVHELFQVAAKVALGEKIVLGSTFNIYRTLIIELNKNLTDKNCFNAELRKLVKDLSIGQITFDESNKLHVFLFILTYHLFKTRDDFAKKFKAVAKLFQNPKKARQKLNIPEVAIHSMEHFLSFLNDSKVTGVVKVKEGKFQTVGNTTAGKTSLIKTITEGKSCLTEEYPALLATKVVEIYGNIPLNYSLRQQLKIDKSDETGSTLVRLEEADDIISTVDEPYKININAFDSGGHQEYALVNDLIITDSSIIAICFDANKYDYSTSIAAFLDVIFTAGQLMVIALIATHCFEGNSLQINEDEVIKSSTDHYLARCKDTKLDKSPILIQKVFKVSSKTCEGIEEMKEGLHAIYANDNLLPLSSNYPLIYKELNLEMRRRMEEGVITLQEVEEIYKELKKNVSMHTDTNFSSNDIEMITEIQQLGKNFSFADGDNDSPQSLDIQPEAASLLTKRHQQKASGWGIKNMWTTFENFLSRKSNQNVSSCASGAQQLEERQRTREVVETVNSTSSKRPLTCLTALQFLEDTGSILMFTNKLGDSIIYPDVPLLTRSLRFVVRHDLADCLKVSNLDMKLVENNMEFNLDWDVKRVLKTGYFSQSLLLLLHDLHRKEEQQTSNVPILDMDHIIQFMEKMGIAEKVIEDETYSLFVPSLLARTIQDLRKEELTTYLIPKNNFHNILGVQYDFQMGFGSMNILNQILVKLHNKEGDCKATVLNAYSERIEMREPGVVSFVHMALDEHDLYIKEEEVSTDDENFYRTRCITAYLLFQGEMGLLEQAKWNAINFVDETAQAVIANKGQKAWTKWLICNQCLIDDNCKHFSLTQDTPKDIGRFRKKAAESLSWDRTNRCSKKNHHEGVFKACSKIQMEPMMKDYIVQDNQLCLQSNVSDTGAQVNAGFSQAPGNKFEILNMVKNEEIIFDVNSSTNISNSSIHTARDAFIGNQKVEIDDSNITTLENTNMNIQGGSAFVGNKQVNVTYNVYNISNNKEDAKETEDHLS